MFPQRNQEAQMASENKQDATHLLIDDHRKVEGLFAKFEKASGDGTKEKLAHEICTELKIHTMLEEEIFYPALRGKIDDADLDEAIVEHDSAKLLITDIEVAAPDNDFYRSEEHTSALQSLMRISYAV